MISLQSGEKILMEVHKHWLAIVLQGFALFVLAIVPLIAVPMVVSYVFADSMKGMEMSVLENMYLFLSAAWLFFVWMMFFVMWTNYYLDILIITNKHLIDMEQFVLFSRDEVMVPLENVEDIKIEVKGIVATILRFGDLQVQTAGATRETITKIITKPQRVLAVLESAVEENKKAS